MDARTRTPEEIFGTHIRYVVPPYQRPYVWTEEKQWIPLWADIERVADAAYEALTAGESVEKRASSHFLGAVVLQALPNSVGYIQARSVVDGQQRLTTLQLLLDAAQVTAAELGNEVDSAALADLVLNNPKKVQEHHERFKVWPSRIDREVFVAAMDDDQQVPTHLRGEPIAAAHEFFRISVRDWATQDQDGDAAVQRRISALTLVLHRFLEVVAIDLTAGDNPQVIFEALNDRGTPLLAADLIKNYIFMQADAVDADAVAWEARYWRNFDEDWWRDEVSQGRYRRSRIDIFFQYWLTMLTADEVPVEEVFRTFRSWAEGRGVSTPAEVQSLLEILHTDAQQFRRFVDLEPHSPEETFYYRIVESMETGVVTPVFLWLLIERHAVSPEQRAKALQALESWIIRRTLLRETGKDYNRVFLGLLKALEDAPKSSAGDVTTDFLASQTAASRTWPTDEAVVESLSTQPLYGRIAQKRIRIVLEAIEDSKRGHKTEEAHCPRGLTIEHVMPQSWQNHWGSDIAPDDQVAPMQRDRAVQLLGNLTLVNERLNPSLSNNPWLTWFDSDGIEHVGKKDQLQEHSLMRMTRDLLDLHPTSWTEDDIRARSSTLAQHIIRIWPRP